MNHNVRTLAYIKQFLTLILFLVAVTVTIAKQLMGNQDIPVTYSIQLPDTVHAGKEIILTTRLEIQPGWHIYAPADVNAQQGMVEAGLWFEVPEGITLTDPSEWPESEGDGGYEVYRDSIRIRQKLLIDPDCKPGKLRINVTLRWQACEKFKCLAPQTEEVKAMVYIRD